MSTDVNSELINFHQFVGEQLSAGLPGLSPEEVLDAWRLEHPSREQFEEDVQAVREALADMDAGDMGIPAESYLQEFRRRHNLGQSS